MGIINNTHREFKSNPSRRGDIAEQVAIAYLLNRGFEVYKNAACTGVFDILAMSPDGEIIKYDVKLSVPSKSHNGTIYANKTLSKNITQEKFKEIGGRFLWVYVNDDFDCVVSDYEDEFYQRLEDKGYKTPRTSAKLTKCYLKYTIMDSTGTIYERYGLKGVEELTKLKRSDIERMVYRNDTSSGWIFIGKEKELIQEFKTTD